MKFNKLFNVILLFISLQLSAQSWQWGKQGGSWTELSGSEEESVISIVTDKFNNSYILSIVGYQNLNIDGIPKTTYENNQGDLVIASFDCNGNYRWSRTIGGSGYDKINRLHIDADNNIYAFGKLSRLNGEAYFRNETGIDITLPSYNGNIPDQNLQTLFAVKYSSNGELLWLRMPQAEDVTLIDAISNSHSLDFHVDSEGNSSWLCLLPSGSYGNGSFVNTQEGRNLFMLKYDSGGNFIEGHPIDLHGFLFYPRLILEKHPINGNYYITAALYNTGGSSEPFTINNEPVEHSMVLAAFDETGNYLWHKESDEPQFGSISNMVIDESGYIYLTGKAIENTMFDNLDLTLNVPEAGHYPFLMKLLPNGDRLWKQRTESNAGYPSTAITVSGNEVTISGYENGLQWGDFSFETVNNRGTDVYFTRFNKYTGEVLGVEKLINTPDATSLFDYSFAISSSQYRDYYLTGRFETRLEVGDDVLTENSPDSDFFIAKFGQSNCNCTLPDPNFIINEIDQQTIELQYTGSSTYNTIHWDFGNGDYTTQENPVYTYVEGGDFVVTVTVENDCGYAQYSMQQTLHIEDYDFELIKVYPNPAEDYLYFDNKIEEYHYTITNIIGQKLKEGYSNTSSLYIGDLLEQVYMLNITTQSGKTHGFKFVKK